MVKNSNLCLPADVLTVKGASSGHTKPGFRSQILSESERDEGWGLERTRLERLTCQLPPADADTDPDWLWLEATSYGANSAASREQETGRHYAPP